MDVTKWLQLTNAGNGQLLLAGTPPKNLLDTLYQVQIYVNDGYKSSPFLYLNISLFDTAPYFPTTLQA